MVMDAVTRAVRQFENQVQPGLRSFERAGARRREAEGLSGDEAADRYRQVVADSEHASYLAADAGRHFVRLQELDADRAAVIERQWTAEIERRIEPSPQRDVFLATVFGRPPVINIDGVPHSLKVTPRG